jgi:DNA polymerase-3 subunit beta
MAMKLSLDLPALQSALKFIQKAIPANPQLPILSSINLKLKNSKLTLAATDLYLGIRATVSVDSKKELNLVIPGDTFKDLINSFSADEVEFEVDEKQLRASLNQSQIKIPIQDAQDYPDFPEVDGQTLTISSEILEEIRSLVSFAPSTDQARPILTAIMLNFSPDGLTAVGTDGFRLAMLNYPDVTTKTEQQLLVPTRAFTEICRIANQIQEEKINLQISPELKQVKFDIGDCEIFVRLIEGDYPPYKKIIPEGFEFRIDLNGEELKKELQRAFVLAKEASNIIKFEIDSDQLTIISSSPSYGEYQGKIAIKNSAKEKKEIAFNANYLLDFLNNVKPEEVEFAMSESLKPAQFTIKGIENFLYIVMPFRVQE